MTSWLVAFASMFALDFIWARYTKAVTLHRSLVSANYAVLILVCNAVVTLGYVGDAWLLVPAATGAWAGTYFGVRKHSASHGDSCA